MKTIFKEGSKVLFIGDSITDCGRLMWMRPLGDGFVSILNRELRVENREMKNEKGEISIVNRGISGNTIDDLRHRWEKDVFDENPDYLFILIGINDIYSYLTDPDYAYLSPEGFQTTYDYLLSVTIEKFPELDITLMDPFLMTSMQTADRYMLPILKLLPEYINVVERMSEQYQCRHIRLHNMFQKTIQQIDERKLGEEPVHPNEYGHQLIAEEILRSISIPS